MTVKSLAVGVLAGALCVSCGPNDPNAAQARGGGKTLAGAADASKAGKASQGVVRIPDAPLVRPPAAAAGNPSMPPSIDQAPAAAAPRAADLSDVPPAPKDAQWTLFCATIGGPDHVQISRALKSSLIKRTSMREWYIVHESSQSRLYYGYYRSIADKGDAAETARAQADRKRIDGLKDGNNERPFSACQFVQLAAPDPESPPQWNIVNAPQDRVWSLIVGAYKDHPERKKFAVDAVRDARARGEEAYYYHGDNVSNVLIGTWPDEAVVEERVDERNGANAIRDSIFVLPPGVQAPRSMRAKDGRNVRVVGQRLVAADPTLQEKIRQYPHMGVNGEFLVYKTNGKATMQTSQVAVIPRPEQQLFQEAPADPGAFAGPGAVANDGRGLDRPDAFSRPGYEDTASRQQPKEPSKSGGSTTGGRLRSIGD